MGPLDCYCCRSLRSNWHCSRIHTCPILDIPKAIWHFLFLASHRQTVLSARTTQHHVLHSPVSFVVSHIVFKPEKSISSVCTFHFVKYVGAHQIKRIRMENSRSCGTATATNTHVRVAVCLVRAIQTIVLHFCYTCIDKLKYSKCCAREPADGAGSTMAMAL